MKLTSTMMSIPRRGRLTLALAPLALAVGMMAVMKLPAGPMPGGGLGPGMDAMHEGDIGPILPRVLEGAKASLDLDARQQLLWDNAAAQSRAVRDAGRTSREQLRDTLVAELAKTEPDLKVFAGAADPLHLEYQAARRTVRDLWLDLYATFTPGQKAVIRDALREKLDRAAAYHDTLREQRQRRAGASGG